MFCLQHCLPETYPFSSIAEGGRWETRQSPGQRPWKPGEEEQWQLEFLLFSTVVATVAKKQAREAEAELVGLGQGTRTGPVGG
jgi:hypothetical protein